MFKCSSADLHGDPGDGRRAEGSAILYTCSIVVMIAGVSSPLSQQHISLLSRQIMGHLCLNSATGVAWAFLIHHLITPPGHRKSQSRERRSDQCCPTGDLLSGWHLDIRRLLSSHRRDRKKKNLRTHEKLSYSLEPWSACVELVTLLVSSHSVCASCRHNLGSRQQEASEVRSLVTTLSPLLG